MTSHKNELPLPGLDGTNPLGFLAALGTLKVCQHSSRDDQIKLSWKKSSGTWLPVLHTDRSLESLIDSIHTTLELGRTSASASSFLQLGKNLSVEPKAFGEAARQITAVATPKDRRAVDMIAAFGCECVTHEKLPRIIPTDLHFIFGSGHQHFLETAAKLMVSVTHDHLREALCGPWKYRDERLSFRLDPSDAREHAYQWTAPGDETTTTVWGANLLAFEGITFITCAPQQSKLETAGFSRHNRQSRFRWPIWSVPVGASAISSVLVMSDLTEDRIDARKLNAMGIQAVYESAKLKLGDGANFKWSFSPAKQIA